MNSGTSIPIFGHGSRGNDSSDSSNAILTESIGVLRDKFGWEPYRLHFGRIGLQKIANLVEPDEILNITDDPDDNRILECAVKATSDYVVTNDDDLLRLHNYRGIEILSAIEFFARMGNREIRHSD